MIGYDERKFEIEKDEGHLESTVLISEICVQ